MISNSRQDKDYIWYSQITAPHFNQFWYSILLKSNLHETLYRGCLSHLNLDISIQLKYTIEVVSKIPVPQDKSISWGEAEGI